MAQDLGYFTAAEQDLENALDDAVILSDESIDPTRNPVGVEEHIIDSSKVNFISEQFSQTKVDEIFKVLLDFPFLITNLELSFAFKKVKSSK